MGNFDGFNVDHIRVCLLKDVPVHIVHQIISDFNVDLCGEILFPHNSGLKMNSKCVRRNLDALKYVLECGCHYSENCWKTSKSNSRLIRDISRECFETWFKTQLMQKCKIGDLSDIVFDYFRSIKLKDDSHNLHRSSRKRSTSYSPSIKSIDPSSYSPSMKGVDPISDLQPLHLSADEKSQSPQILPQDPPT